MSRGGMSCTVHPFRSVNNGASPAQTIANGMSSQATYLGLRENLSPLLLRWQIKPTWR